MTSLGTAIALHQPIQFSSAKAEQDVTMEKWILGTSHRAHCQLIQFWQKKKTDAACGGNGEDRWSKDLHKQQWPLDQQQYVEGAMQIGTRTTSIRSCKQYPPQGSRGEFRAQSRLYWRRFGLICCWISLVHDGQIY